MTSLDIGAIEVDKDSEGYRELMHVTKRYKEEEMGQDLKDRQERLRINREENQYAARKQTQSANLGAFQIEKQVEVGVAGAEALGKMGSNNAGNVSLGSGAGFNPAAMMASVAVGGVVGQNIASIMKSSMNPSETQASPPPIPKTTYSVAKDGKPTGPFDIEVLTQKALAGEFSRESLVWKPGMEKWTKANDVEELKTIFPPEII